MTESFFTFRKFNDLAPALRLLTFLLLFLNGCHSSNQLLTNKEFVHIYYDSLSARFPDARFTIIDDSTIASNYKGNSLRYFTANAFIRYQAQPDSMGSILKDYVSSVGDIFNSTQVTTADIVATIKPVSYLTEGARAGVEMGAKKGFDCIYDKYNEQLIVVYAVDTKNSIRSLTAEDMGVLSLQRDSLRALATRNLKRLLPDIKIAGDKGFYMFTAGGNYEASLILLQPLWTKENLPVNGDFIIAMPSRDVLAITGSNDAAGIEKLKALIAKIYGQGSYSLSEHLYKWNGKYFEKYE